MNRTATLRIKSYILNIDRDIFVDGKVDFFNYHAVGLLERLGNLTPSQVEIDLVEKLLRNILTVKI